LNLLLDTHALIWWALEDKRLPRRASQAIADPDNTAYISAASSWEMAIKFKMGKLPEAAPLIANLRGGAGLDDFTDLAISREHAIRAGLLDFEHKDPFDRLLIAQAEIEGLTLISNEQLFDRFGIARLWD
jgi:PIN domain nuclease of toxin-antitoxin system